MNTTIDLILGDVLMHNHEVSSIVDISSYYLKLDQSTPQTTVGTFTFPSVIATNYLKTPKIYPSADSTTAIQILKADGTTSILNVDTTNGNVGIGTMAPAGRLHINGTVDDQQLIVEAHSTQTANLAEWRNSSGTVQTALAGNGRDFVLDSTTGSKIGTATTQKLGFWNKTPVIQQVTNAYTSDSESVAYTGIDNAQAGTPYAQVTDLNALRTAYETLRASYDDLLTKLRNTGVIA